MKIASVYDRTWHLIQQASHSLVGLWRHKQPSKIRPVKKVLMQQWITMMTTPNPISCLPDLVIPGRQATYVTFIDFGACCQLARLRTSLIHEAGLVNWEYDLWPFKAPPSVSSPTVLPHRVLGGCRTASFQLWASD